MLLLTICHAPCAGAVGARYFTYMWAEMLSLLEKGFLHIPDDVTIVWADDGSGIIKGKPLVKEGQVCRCRHPPCVVAGQCT